MKACARRSQEDMDQRQQAAPAEHGPAWPAEHRELPDRLAEISTDGIFFIQNERVRVCNAFLSVMAGYGMDEVEGTCFASFFDPDSIPTIDAVCRQPWPLHRMESVFKAILCCKNGDRLDVQLKAAGCRFDGKPAVLVTMSLLGNRVSASARDAVDRDRFCVSKQKLVRQPACS